MIKYEILENKVRLYNIENFDLEQTFDCGQCFRFDKSPLGGYEGIIGHNYGRIVSIDRTTFDIIGANKENIQSWIDFLNLETDYSKIKEDILNRFNNDYMKEAIEYGWGIRILKQDEWEAICSFIISQNNNIPRIKKIISTICEKFGDKIIFDGKTYYSFPSPLQLIDAGENAIFDCKTGFRAKYIISACESIASGNVDINALKMQNNEDIAAKLCGIKGIGPKVAACAVLYGFNKLDSFPIDVWVKRIIDTRFGGILNIDEIGPYAGVAQQYMFYYERSL